MPIAPALVARSAVALLCATVLVGCSPAPRESVFAATQAASTQAASMQAAPSASAGVAATASTHPAPTPAATEPHVGGGVFESELCPGGTGFTCVLDAGEHRSLGFGDGIAFTLTSSWVVRANETDVIALEMGDLVNPLALDLITGAPRIRSATSTQETIRVPVTDAAAARSLLLAFDAHGFGKVSVIERPMVTVAGLEFVVFDVSADGDIELFTEPVTERAHMLAAGRVARFLWSSWNGGPFILVIESDAATLDRFVEDAIVVLKTLEFGDED